MDSPWLGPYVSKEFPDSPPRHSQGIDPFQQRSLHGAMETVSEDTKGWHPSPGAAANLMFATY